MTKTNIDEAYERGVKSGQEAGLIDSVFHDMTHIVANTVIGASGLGSCVAKESEAEEKGYQYGLAHRASPAPKENDSYVSSSSYTSSSDCDTGSSDNWIVWLAGLFIVAFGVCKYNSTGISGVSRSAVAPLSVTEPAETSNRGSTIFTTGYMGGQQGGENASLSSLIGTDDYKKVSSNRIAHRDEPTPAINMLEKKLSENNVKVNLSLINSRGEHSYVININYDVRYNNQEIRGGQKIIQLNTYEEDNKSYVFPTNTFKKREYNSQELRGAQKLMQLNKKRKVQKP